MFLRIVFAGLLALATGAAVVLKFKAAATADASAPPIEDAPPADGAYPIKLARPAQVGDTYHFVGDATVVFSGLANVAGYDHTIKPYSLTLHLEATERVLAVGARGEPTRASYTVSRCAAREENRDVDLLSRGTVLTVDAGRWESTVQSSRGSVRIIDEQVLRAILSLPTVGDFNADDAFGTPGPQKVGESWAVHPEPLARLVAREGFPVDKRSASGTVTLAGVQTVAGVPCLRVQAKAVVRPWLPNPKDLPEGVNATSGSVEIRFTKLVPAGPAGLCLADTRTDRFVVKARTDEASVDTGVLMDAKGVRSIGIKRTPIRVASVAR
jgi:hypothetical protein